MKLLYILSQITITEDQLDIPTAQANDATVAVVLQLVFAVLGAVALLIIVLAGMKYTLSQGNPDATTKARNTIIYAAVGLVIATMAFTIVRFVVRTSA